VTTSAKPTRPVAADEAAITGTDTVGHTLKCSRGDWVDSPAAYHYKWSRDGVPLIGATGPTYEVAPADAGHGLSCTVTATNAAGASHTASAQVAVALTVSSACPVPTGSLAGTALGPVSLGATQEHVRAQLPRFDLYSFHTDNFCLRNGYGIRVGYASSRLLGEAHMPSTLTGRVILALTANRYYSFSGVRPGMRVSAIARQSMLSAPLRWGRNTWYVVPGPVTNGVFKVRHGIIDEVGIAHRELIGHRAAERQLLRSF
jgi:hypothetical protein